MRKHIDITLNPYPHHTSNPHQTSTPPYIPFYPHPFYPQFRNPIRGFAQHEVYPEAIISTLSHASIFFMPPSPLMYMYMQRMVTSDQRKSRIKSVQIILIKTCKQHINVFIHRYIKEHLTENLIFTFTFLLTRVREL